MAITKPGDVKALLDTASKALELADKLQQERSGTSSYEEIAAIGAKLLDQITEARRKDFAFMAQQAAEAACRVAGISDIKPVLKAAAEALGMVLNEKGEIDDGGSGSAGSGGNRTATAGIGIGGANDDESHEVGGNNDLDEMMRKLRGE